MSEILKQARNEQYVLRIMQDDDTENPRDWDNLGKMYCWHRQYNLGDKHNFDASAELFRALIDEANIAPAKIIAAAENDSRLKIQGWVCDVHSHKGTLEYSFSCESDADLAQNLLEELPDSALLQLLLTEGYIIQPLYLYDHSMLSISTSSFVGRAQHANWDSGQVGWVVVTPKQLKDEYNNSPDAVETATKVINAEVETYDQYLRGDVYGYVLLQFDDELVTEYCRVHGLEKADFDNDDVDACTTEVNSCWGFFGDDWKVNGVADDLPDEAAELIDKLA